MLVEIHKETKSGDVYTLKQRCGLRARWNGKQLHVPRGFESDGASVPRFFWRVVFPPCDSKALRAAFLHDYVYRNRPQDWTREEADKMFRDILIRDGMAKWRAWIAYFGVRFFGGSSWTEIDEKKEMEGGE